MPNPPIAIKPRAPGASPPTASASAAAAVADDPFFARFFDRISAAERDSFDADQLAAIKRAFGAQMRGVHRVDIRASLPLPFWPCYLVILMGPERRSATRLAKEATESPLFSLGNLIFLAGLTPLLLLAGLVFAYLLKSLLGIDLLPGTSLGLWATVKEQWNFLSGGP